MIFENEKTRGEKFDYFGQAKNKNEREGFGRVCMTDGQLIEGYFKNSSLNGYGRVIYTG